MDTIKQIRRVIKDGTMNRKKVVTAFNSIGILASICGIVLYFTVDGNWAIWCAAISLFSSILNVLFGNQNTLITEVLFAIVGFVIASIFELPIIPIISLSVCGEHIFMTFIAPLLVFAILSLKVKTQKKKG
jgi:hypothetical protein